MPVPKESHSPAVCGLGVYCVCSRVPNGSNGYLIERVLMRSTSQKDYVFLITPYNNNCPVAMSIAAAAGGPNSNITSLYPTVLAATYS